MTGLVRGLVAGLASALVTLAAHWGLHLDQETVAIVLTALVGAMASGGLHWAERHIPAVNRAANWVGRRSGELTLMYGKFAGPPTYLLPPITAPAGMGHVQVITGTAATTGSKHVDAGDRTEPTTGPQTPSGLSSANPPSTPPAADVDVAAITRAVRARMARDARRT